MNTSRRIFAALALCGMFLTPAYAGGGKRNASIFVKNETAVIIGVAVDPGAALLGSTSLADFQARGGKILNPGESVKFTTREGAHRVIAAVDEVAPLVDAETNVTVSRGGTRTVSLTPTGFVN